MDDVAIPPAPPASPCLFKKAWIGMCGKPGTNGRCTEHEGFLCVVCGAQATHECDYTSVRAFVCGIPLCDSCRHDPYDTGKASYASNHMNSVQYAAVVAPAPKEA